MPTYEYLCTSCGERLEAVQSFSDPALSACRVCGGPLRKVFGNVGIVLKGSGFYKTDSRSSRANGSRKEKAASGDGATKSTDTAKEASSTTKEPSPAPESHKQVSSTASASS
ncbi:MAG: FmdB family zinc ribbon protein [Acidimicrobiales bacterium]